MSLCTILMKLWLFYEVYSIVKIIVWKYNFNEELTLDQIQKSSHPQRLIRYHSNHPGKVKQTIYDLPPEAHSYGKKVVNDPEPMKHGKGFLIQWFMVGKKHMRVLNQHQS